MKISFGISTEIKPDFISIWFIAVFIAVLVYCVKNWEQVIIFEPFTGNAVMFCMLIVWTFLPFLKKIKFMDFEGDFNSPLHSNKNEAELRVQETASNTPNITVDVNIQNKYNDEVNDIIKEKGVANV